MSDGPKHVSNVRSSAVRTEKPCCMPYRGDALSDVSTAAQAPQTRSASSSAMLQIPACSFLMGTQEPDGFPQDGEGPVREVILDAFQIGQYPVTNAEFRQFVAATAYVTEAERFGWSFVFWAQIPPERFRAVVKDTAATAPWWCQVEGACWSAPEGPGSEIASRLDHPVVHVSWGDATNFCDWSGTRLPSEAEWECAARGGLAQKRYAWGDELLPAGVHRCNIWQGVFPEHDAAEDGYAGTCPVNAFPANEFGMYSACGNTWEWCADWFSATHHVTAGRVNPKGPSSGVGRVMKGGSFLCHASYCNRYRVGARSSSTPNSSSSNVGFRCAR